MKTNRFLSLAAMLCISLLLSCTTNIEPPPPPLPPSSSSDLPPSSSSVDEDKDYCVYPEIQQCYYGPYSVCPGIGGILGNSCPYSSSGTVAASSSSLGEVGGGSSSSSVQSGESSSSNGGITPEYSYCVFDTMCLNGPVSTCPPGGTLSNACPYLSSSSSPAGGSSSSVAVPSSSSVAKPSSSSVATYTVTYNANGGSGGPVAQTKIQDVVLVLSAAVPARANHTFAGWNTAANGSGTAYAAGASYTANANVTLYAQWSQLYTVTYNYGGSGGSGLPAAQTKIQGVELVLSAVVPARANYTFAGWNTAANGNGTAYASGASYTANASVTLYAQWTAIPLTDSRDGKEYKWVNIGTQVWMAENLNYAASGSKCGNGDVLSDANTATCDTYGRLYNWATAMVACPSGWHLPSDAEWGALMQRVNSSCSLTGNCANAGRSLKATSGWNSYEGKSGNGTDTYGFSALPGGSSGNDGNGFYNVGLYGYWWSASEVSSYYAYYRNMGYSYESVTWGIDNGGDKRSLNSVRCLQD